MLIKHLKEIIKNFDERATVDLLITAGDCNQIGRDQTIKNVEPTKTWKP